MAYPKLLQKLFQNEGAGDKLNPNLIPELTETLVVNKSKNSIDGNDANGYIQINANGNLGGGQVRLYGKNNSELAGGVRLYANDGSGDKTLSIEPSGSLKWCNNEVLTTNNGLPVLGTISMVDLGFTAQSTVSIVDFFKALYAKFGSFYGTKIIKFNFLYATQAYISFPDKSSVCISGGTLLIYMLGNLDDASSYSYCSAVYFPVSNINDTCWMYAANAQGNTSFFGRKYLNTTSLPSGTALSASYHSGTTWYRKYSDGFIMQGGEITGNGAKVSVTFPLAFTSNPQINFTVVSATSPSGDSSGHWIYSRSLTGFTPSLNWFAGTQRPTLWIACGY